MKVNTILVMMQWLGKLTRSCSSWALNNCYVVYHVANFVCNLNLHIKNKIIERYETPTHCCRRLLVMLNFSLLSM